MMKINKTDKEPVKPMESNFCFGPSLAQSGAQWTAGREGRAQAIWAGPFARAGL